MDAAGIIFRRPNRGIRDIDRRPFPVAEHAISILHTGIYSGSGNIYCRTSQCQQARILSIPVAILRIG